MKILLNKTEATLVEKKSKFIATLIPIKNEEEAINNIDIVKKKYYDARHNVYAYRTGIDNIIYKSSDDGEPSGTAGKPMMNILEGEDLTNVLIVVTRYFGGILLGTGGLVKAYSGSLKLSIEEASKNDYIKEVYSGLNYNIKINYDKLGKIENFFKNEDDIYIINKQFDENICIDLLINENKIEKVEKFLIEIFSGDLNKLNEKKVNYYINNNKTIIL